MCFHYHIKGISAAVDQQKNALLAPPIHRIRKLIRVVHRFVVHLLNNISSVQVRFFCGTLRRYIGD
jgi:hypothetical protein